MAAVVAAGLVGGGAGAAGTYLLGDHNHTNPITSSLDQPTPRGNNAAAPPSGSAQAVADQVLPSVVSITATTNQGIEGGSGAILSSDGKILTNNHVVADAAGGGGSLEVTFQNGKSAKATIIGRDPTSDLAVIRAQGVSGLKPIQLGNSSALRVGQQVVAIGSPLGLSGTVTSGIVSALDRPVRTGSDSQSMQSTDTVIDAIQTDAAINHGNSGGPLVDMSGRLVGINSAIASAPGSSGDQGGNIGIGFAIPIDEARPIAKELVDNGRARHAQIGVTLQVSSNPYGQAQNGSVAGARISQVNPNSAASRAGLRPGDVVTRVDQRTIADADSLIAAVRSHRPGQEVTITYDRNGTEHTVKVTLGSDSGSR